MSDNIIAHIYAWLKNQLADTRMKGYVVGLSGGLDSAVCAALLRRVSDDSLGLILPIESSLDDLDDASLVANTFNIKTEYIDLTTVYQTFVRLLPDNDTVAQGNVKARLRMVALYNYANRRRYLVCGTGNKTELTLGYFTKFGDGACDVLPLGDLYKHQVKAIARELGVPEKVINKVPSAGLWQGQTDEGEIGYSYDEMDATLRDIATGKATGTCAEKLQEMIIKSEHKREPPKICYITDQEGE